MAQKIKPVKAWGLVIQNDKWHGNFEWDRLCSWTAHSKSEIEKSVACDDGSRNACYRPVRVLITPITPKKRRAKR